MKCRVLKDRVLIKPSAVESNTKPGIVMPNELKLKPSEGTVVVIGKDVDELQVGDKVTFAAGSGIETKYEGEVYLLMLDREIHLIL